jgi:type IV pilus assembly protein PilW
MKNFHNKQTGLTLVEILVALVISLFLLGGIVQVYLGHKSSYRFSDASSRIQENGRFSIDSITTDVRMAGFFGCVDIRTNSDLVQNHLDDSVWNPEIYDFINQPPVELAGGGINNSDSIIVRGSRAGQSSLSATLPLPGSDPIQVTGSTVFSDNDIVLITNCWTTDIFQATTASLDAGTGVTTLSHSVGSGSPGNKTLNLNGGIANNLDSAYSAYNSSVYVLQSVTYTIQDSASGSGEPALWRQVNSDAPVELIEGVEQMIALYGIDTDNDGVPNQYLPSSTVIADPNQVAALRVFLVVRSDRDNVLDSSQTYTLNGVNVTAADNRVRQVFSTTIDLRNR